MHQNKPIVGLPKVKREVHWEKCTEPKVGLIENGNIRVLPNCTLVGYSTWVNVLHFHHCRLSIIN